ncbi:hypothetical protein, partial [Mesorhizobium sp.]|uniref:hypothetical protein n=1 Tax=Mesorhizobium sp. TaxID=1871066 RepID=UPI0025F27270
GFFESFARFRVYHSFWDVLQLFDHGGCSKAPSTVPVQRPQFDQFSDLAVRTLVPGVQSEPARF